MTDSDLKLWAGLSAMAERRADGETTRPRSNRASRKALGPSAMGAMATTLLQRFARPGAPSGQKLEGAVSARALEPASLTRTKLASSPHHARRHAKPRWKKQTPRHQAVTGASSPDLSLQEHSSPRGRTGRASTVLGGGMSTGCRRRHGKTPCIRRDLPATIEQSFTQGPGAEGIGSNGNHAAATLRPSGRAKRSET